MARKTNLEAWHTVAASLANRLAALVEGAGWELDDPEFEANDPSEVQYGIARVATFDEAVDFCVWVDRTQVEGAYDDPILVAAFGAAGKHATALAHLAREDGIRARGYGYDSRARKRGFRGDAVLDVPGNRDRFLSCYRPSGELDEAAAFTAFAAFFRRYRGLVEAVPATKLARPEAELAALRDVLAELAVLAQLRGATWIGHERLAHDIEHGDLSIAVRATTTTSIDVTLAQLDAAADPDFRFALVDVPRITGAADLAPIIKKQRTAIERYLAGLGVACKASTLRTLSAALPGCRVELARLAEPRGFRAALEQLETFAGVTTLSLPRDRWFVPAGP